MGLKVWFLETRPRFLLLPPVVSFLGNSISWYMGTFSWGYGFLSFLGLLLLHVSTNLLNDYFDYRNGIDMETERTKFSGGSGLLTRGFLNPGHVFWVGFSCFLLVLPIGLYFILARGLLLLPLLLAGAVCVLFYTPLITRVPWPEWAPGVGLGYLPILGIYFVQNGTLTIPVAIVSIPSGILVHNLLLLNEFPDVQADERGGRKTLPVIIGKEKTGIVFSVLIIFVYFWIIVSVIAGIMPPFCLISFVSLPLAKKSIQGALKPPKETIQLVTPMKNNTMLVLSIQILLGIGYILAGF
ncbi:hypothetical protein AKJ61_02745 [candidate division MSBL1 archaeon SCGC-AAA259B11]|uniref:Ubiquinone biosynthesis protein UbiA n=1 Tax=candidate division MSBL1 archaeon SCGC-AAA259B11 TaxID=1698260 RepID=A0A133U5L5_9EURY|nr:hypothetical protein AKJ61_02745 [candidate division MSBL1 archaeon SCGC-AAA259B11]